MESCFPDERHLRKNSDALEERVCECDDVHWNLCSSHVGGWTPQLSYQDGSCKCSWLSVWPTSCSKSWTDTLTKRPGLVTSGQSPFCWDSSLDRQSTWLLKLNPWFWFRLSPILLLFLDPLLVSPCSAREGLTCSWEGSFLQSWPACFGTELFLGCLVTRTPITLWIWCTWWLVFSQLASTSSLTLKWLLKEPREATKMFQLTLWQSSWIFSTSSSKFCES